MIDVLPLSRIIIGARRREDHGDIDGLAESIARYGLLHPIVVDDDDNLVAGERRLRACQQLGRTEIEIRRLGTLSEAERREIELEENLRRKDLTPYERAKTIATLADNARQIAETCTESVQVSKPARGPAREPGSYRDVAERTGVPVQTIRDAEQHVAAVERYPELAGPGVTQADALTIAKNLDALPEPARETKRADMAAFKPGAWADVAEKPPMPPPVPKRPAGERWIKALHDVMVILNSVRDHGGILKLSRTWDAPAKRAFVAQLGRISATLAEWEEQLMKEVDDEVDVA